MQALRFIIKKRKLFQLFSCLLLISCSTSKWLINYDQKILSEKSTTFGREERSSLLFSIQSTYNQFFQTNKNKIKSFSKKTSSYLNGLLVINEYGESLKLGFKYYYFNTSKVIFFVSPSGEVVLSKGLLENFVQTESILQVILSECYLRNKYGVYTFIEFPPTGHKETKHLSRMLLVKQKSKRDLNLWVYELLKHNGVDTNSLLDWIQAKNRNSHLANYISMEKRESLKEEQQIKDYLLARGIHNEVENLEVQSSSFFYFKREFSF